MIAGCVTKSFGVIASDSALYDVGKGETSFETPKIFSFAGKYLATFIGSPLYFGNLDKSKLHLRFDEIILYLQRYFRETKPDIEHLMRETIKDEDENKPHFCFFLLGLHGKRPTLAQFNSFNDFKPKYLWTDKEPKFSTILYGDDSNPAKQKIFKESTSFMEKKAADFKELSPGLACEILTRGIYKKADLEEKIGLKKKYAGGAVGSAVINDQGLLYTLSGVEVLNGRV